MSESPQAEPSFRLLVAASYALPIIDGDSPRLAGTVSLQSPWEGDGGFQRLALYQVRNVRFSTHSSRTGFHAVLVSHCYQSDRFSAVKSSSVVAVPQPRLVPRAGLLCAGGFPRVPGLSCAGEGKALRPDEIFQEHLCLLPTHLQGINVFRTDSWGLPASATCVDKRGRSASCTHCGSLKRGRALPAGGCVSKATQKEKIEKNHVNRCQDNFFFFNNLSTFCSLKIYFVLDS